MELTENKKEILRKVIEKEEQSADIQVFKKIKDILNIQFGEEHNQLVRPTFEAGMKYLADNTNIDILNGLKNPVFESWLQNELPKRYSIIIHFPEIEVTNSRKQTHLIRDLYVKIDLNGNGTIHDNMRGVRTTLTKDEALGGYAHSHLPGTSPTHLEFRNFCLGSGEIGQVLSLLRSNFDEVNFAMLCMHIKTYVGWESIEGVPYVRIGNILSRGAVANMEQYANPCAEDLVKDFLKLTEEEIIELGKFTVSEYGIEIEKTDELEQWLGGKISEYMKKRRVYGDNYLAHKDDQGNYFRIDTRNTSVLDHQKTPILTFKGKEVFLKIIESQSTIKREIYANPHITEEFCYQLTKILTKQAYDNDGTNWDIDTSESIEQAPEPSSVSVLESTNS